MAPKNRPVSSLWFLRECFVIFPYPIKRYRNKYESWNIYLEISCKENKSFLKLSDEMLISDNRFSRLRQIEK
ncbi:hypothetical protein BpHYR1_049528 [Brachionus plicatilis]|uniref:Uncharacterized protein n=1 Tax=Brachionus plicatilis TaxID=10195 RepID=A0A3M7QQ30_BRAPC|nr:hypothetical protein BpHYR1_049528 [Brachionus plicatilis]